MMKKKTDSLKKVEASYFEGLLKFRKDLLSKEQLQEIAFQYYALKNIPKSQFQTRFNQEIK